MWMTSHTGIASNQSHRTSVTGPRLVVKRENPEVEAGLVVHSLVARGIPRFVGKAVSLIVTPPSWYIYEK
jgi:hypothetical protein